MQRVCYPVSYLAFVLMDLRRFRPRCVQKYPRLFAEIARHQERDFTEAVSPGAESTSAESATTCQSVSIFPSLKRLVVGNQCVAGFRFATA